MRLSRQPSDTYFCGWSFLLSASVSKEGSTGASSWDSDFVSVDLGSLDNEYGNYPYPDPTGTGIISP